MKMDYSDSSKQSKDLGKKSWEVLGLVRNATQFTNLIASILSITM
jgi:hypothetical protein